LRRAIRPFTVEVRHRPRWATAAKTDAQSSETKSAPAAFERESQRAAVAAFGARDADRSLVDVMASHPRGRILPSLVSDERWHRLLEDASVSAADSEPPSRAPKRPAARAPKGGDQASESPKTSGFSSGGNVSLAARSSTKSHRTSREQSDEGPSASPKEPMRAPSQVVDDSRGLAPTTKGRRRTIMARYVFGDDDKPGGRWKWRLFKS
jgi:hypothetical protein